MQLNVLEKSISIECLNASIEQEQVGPLECKKEHGDRIKDNNQDF